MKKFLGTLVLVCAVAIGSSTLLPAPALAQVAGIYGCDSLTSNGCQYVGTARYTNYFNTWTDWGSDDDNFDPDFMRLYTGSAIPADTDIRIVMQAQDVNTPCGFLSLYKCADGGGTVIYGPWASDGGGWSSWVTDVDGLDPDQYRVYIETRAMSNLSITDYNVELQGSNSLPQAPHYWETSGCGYFMMAAGTNVTPLISTGGGWTGFAGIVGDGQTYGNYYAGDVGSRIPDPNCMRTKLNVTLTYDKPVTTLRLYKNGTLTPAPGNAATVDYNDTLAIGWSGTNSTSNCQKFGPFNPPDFTVSGPSGSDAVNGPTAGGASVTYKVRCGNAYVWGDPDTLTITRTVPPPVTTMWIRVNNGTWYSNTSAGVVNGTLTINSGDQITVEADGTNSPTSCTKTSGAPADWTTSTNPDTTVTEPPAGQTYTFSAHCDNAGGVGTTDTIKVFTSTGQCNVNGNIVDNGVQQNYYTASVPYGQCSNSSYYVNSKCVNGTMTTPVGSQYVVAGTCPQAGAPTATLYVTKAGSSETTNNIAINSADTISLRWTSTNATSCTASANTADATFSTGGSTANTDPTVAEPAAGTSRTYTVSCTDGFNVASDSIVVSASSCLLNGQNITTGNSGVAWSQQNPTTGQCTDYDQTFTCSNGTLSPAGSSGFPYTSCIDPIIPPQSTISLTANGVQAPASITVRQGTSVSLVWNGGANPGSCTLTGTGGYTVNSGTVPNSTPSGSATVTVNQKSVFTFKCILGSSSQTQTSTVNITPTVIEI